jgi:hypothetical protein
MILEDITEANTPSIIIPTDIQYDCFTKALPEDRQRLELVYPEFDLFLCTKNQNQTVYIHILLK